MLNCDSGSKLKKNASNQSIKTQLMKSDRMRDNTRNVPINNTSVAKIDTNPYKDDPLVPNQSYRGIWGRNN